MTGTSRDIGLTGAGKGSRPRNCGSKAFHQNYDAISFRPPWPVYHPDEGFKRTGNKLTKRYK